jgi:Zn-dependent protease
MENLSLETIKIVATIIALLIAIIGHEIMHGFVAYLYGDTTAKYNGRLSINPISHIDPIGSIVVPLGLYLLQAPFLFGWAKPVPVDINRVIKKGGLLGAVNVSLAGVGYNLVLAIFSASILNSIEDPQNMADAFIFYIFFQLVVINTFLAIFNLWPIPKFDGANALIYLSLMTGTRKIYDFYEKAEPFSLPILVVILMIPQVQQFLISPAFMIIRELLN